MSFLTDYKRVPGDTCHTCQQISEERWVFFLPLYLFFLCLFIFFLCFFFIYSLHSVWCFKFQQTEDNRSSHVDLTYSTDIPTNIANIMGVRTKLVMDKCINKWKLIWLNIYDVNLNVMKTTTELGYRLFY